jgi:hypothetical protein
MGYYGDPASSSVNQLSTTETFNVRSSDDVTGFAMMKRPSSREMS